MKDLSLHPCFNEGAKHTQARVHLPVAPKCNIQCNYCNRLYDCCNESRPGVTSSVLSPAQAALYTNALMEKLPNLSVIGIAGPGDPFANPDETLGTIELIEKEHPEMIYCLSSNGLDLAPHIDRIAELNVSHVTITINSLNVETLAQIYSWVRYNKKVYRGLEGAKLLLEKQLYCVEKLKEKGMMVKINTVIIPGVNDQDIEELAKKMAEMGADTMNCIPMYPTANTAFEELEEPSKEMMKEIKAKISKYIKPMGHCARCRADAAGLLGKDLTEAMDMIKQFSALVVNQNEERKNVAVATHEGLLVNLHLGEAKHLHIFEQTKNGYKFIEKRATPPQGSGDERWTKIANDVLYDCQAVLVAGVGERPSTILQNNGVRVIQMSGLIDSGLDAVYLNKPLKTLCKSDFAKCGESCRGNSMGCG
ncbi:radical SAM protein [Parabacteroides sp. FAFU027]|uniref:radical SAM protein n=1 Tax=Parabacteroides sp. FAFU027 TaxID=2922715 RepID=UPI001FAF7C2A|nr:radical SAM protein [Parabacteroides sp. FAFU027]